MMIQTTGGYFVNSRFVWKMKYLGPGLEGNEDEMRFVLLVATPAGEEEAYEASLTPDKLARLSKGV